MHTFDSDIVIWIKLISCGQCVALFIVFARHFVAFLVEQSRPFTYYVSFEAIVVDGLVYLVSDIHMKVPNFKYLLVDLRSIGQTKLSLVNELGLLL